MSLINLKTNLNTMNLAANNQPEFEDFGVQFNEKPIDDLFKEYEAVGFLYPSKKELLLPHFSKITENWKALIKSKENLLWVLSTGQENNNNYSSVSVLKQSNYGLFAQHLVSNGNPFLSLKVLLAAQYKAQFHYDEKEVKSSQNWFRPNNRYAYRIFASMFDKLGAERASIKLFQYLHLKLADIQNTPSKDLLIQEITGIDTELIAFVKHQYGSVFVKGEELDRADIQLNTLNTKFQQYGLKRYRKIIKIKCPNSQKVVGVAIANRAPIGINFSFLENRAYYILDESLETAERAIVLKAMNASVKNYYQDFTLQNIPIVTDETTSEILQNQKATFSRAYMQSIWLREGFSLWYEHIQSFLLRIESRLKKVA